MYQSSGCLSKCRLLYQQPLAKALYPHCSVPQRGLNATCISPLDANPNADCYISSPWPRHFTLIALSLREDLMLHVSVQWMLNQMKIVTLYQLLVSISPLDANPNADCYISSPWPRHSILIALSLREDLTLHVSVLWMQIQMQIAISAALGQGTLPSLLCPSERT